MNENAGVPAYLLIASGAITILYSILYLLWTFIAVGLPMIGAIGSVSDGSNTPGEAAMAGLMMAAVPLLQSIGFLVTMVMGAVTAFGGLRLNSWRSKGVVMLAIVCSTGAPALAMLINAGSALNIGACGLGCITGCLLGNIPTAFVLLFGVVASIYAMMAVNGSPERFAQE